MAAMLDEIKRKVEHRERVTRGLVPYALNAKLSAAAQGQADDIAKSGKYSHSGSDGSTPTQRMQRAGYGAYSWGLRVGENYAAYQDAQQVMQFWMGSPPHRANILNQAYREFGIGVCSAGVSGGKGRRVGLVREPSFATGPSRVRVRFAQHPLRFCRMENGQR